MMFYIEVLMTVFNILLFCVLNEIIKDFKINQIRFINQQNRNTAAIFEIKESLKEMKANNNEHHRNI